MALTAQDIGAEGNIGKDSKLAVADFVKYLPATAIEDFLVAQVGKLEWFLKRFRQFTESVERKFVCDCCKGI